MKQHKRRKIQFIKSRNLSAKKKELNAEVLDGLKSYLVTNQPALLLKK